MEWALVLVTALIAASFLFSAAETALTSLGKLEIQSLSAQGGKSGKLIQHWIRDPGRLLVIVLVGNNLANIAASSLMTLWASHYTDNVVAVIMGLFTFVVIFFAEIVPKLLARRTAVQMAPSAIRFLIIIGWFMWPLVWLVQRMSSGVVMLSGMPGRELRQMISEEELTHTIQLAAREGSIDRETSTALRNLLEFQDILAHDVMTPRASMSFVSVSWTREEVMRYVGQDGHSRYPVVRNSNLDDVVGLLHVKDLLHARGQSGAWTRVVHRPYFISELSTLGSVLHVMKSKGVHMALVRNETGLLTGLITLEDVIEEIVGDIRDEHDDPTAGHGSGMGGPRLVSSEIPILDFNDRFSAAIPLGVGYSTLNGYLLAKCGGELPPVGTMIVDDDVTFRIHSIDSNGVASVEILEQKR